MRCAAFNTSLDTQNVKFRQYYFNAVVWTYTINHTKSNREKYTQ